MAARPSLAEETSQVEALVERALGAALAKQSRRRDLDDERKELAEMSLQLTTSRTREKRYKVLTAFLTAVLGGAGAMVTTCIATWEQAKSAAVEPAAEAKAVAHDLAADVAQNRERIDGLETSLVGLERDLGVLGRKLDRILDELESPERPRR